MDSLVWAFWHLFPSSMTGLFESELATDLFELNKVKKEGISNLYEEEVEVLAKSIGNMSSISKDEGENMYELY